MNEQHLNALTEQIIAAAIAVHGHFGPGLLESVYEDCMALELAHRGLRFEQQKRLPVQYRGRVVGDGFRIDLLVENAVLVEIKSVERFAPVHSAQVLSYLRLTGCKVGLLLNFYVKWFTHDGIKRHVLNFPDERAGSSR
jgi:GxxExxY protein